MICQINSSSNSTSKNTYWKHQVIPRAFPTGTTYRIRTSPEANYTPTDLQQTLEIAVNLLVDILDRSNTSTIHSNSSTRKFTLSSNHAAVIFVFLSDK